MLLNELVKHFSKTNSLDQMARYHLSTGGKCLRAQLALLEAKNVNLEYEIAIQWALACELLHNATLIHDDIQDNDPVRRGQPSLWKKFGVGQAINVGDYFIFKAFRLASLLETPQLPFLLAETSELLVQGQTEELNVLLNCERQGYWPAYLKMAQLKTGTLFKLPIEGIHLLKNNEAQKENLSCWLDLGISYQIFDDIRDFYGLKQDGQKQKDFTEKRINALIAFLSKDLKHKNIIKDYLNVKENSAEQIDIIKNISQHIIENSIVDQLSTIAQDKLHQFRASTTLETQSLVLSFLNNSITIPGDTHVQASP